MQRQPMTPDRSLTLGRPAQVELRIELTPPVVRPHPAGEEATVAEPLAPPAPVVRPRRSRRDEEALETGPAPVAVTPVRVVEREAPQLHPGTIWAPPIPAFTYLAGAAGSGKTFATRAWADADPGVLLCATTGIAAINLGGETVNAVLGYFDTHSLQESYLNGFLTARLGKLWKAGITRLVLDEVSMLAADQLTFLVQAIEEVNGRGYVLGKWTADDDTTPPAMGLTLVGDFLQLSPVKATYAFESPEWNRFAAPGHTITLTGTRRQTDADFIAMLGAARRGDGATVADYFVSRGQLQAETDDRFDGPTILAKNESVDRFNALRLGQVHGDAVRFPSTRWGKERSEWKHIPEVLDLKLGALVMILANYRDPVTRQLLYVNGDLGVVIDAEEGTAWVRLQRTQETVQVVPVTREVKVPIDSARRTQLRKDGLAERIDGKWEIVGAITYLPLRVAYASTTHKSQGLSLDKVQVTIADAFFKAPGMVYVALSRARTAAGLRLVGTPRALIERCVCDPRLRSWL